MKILAAFTVLSAVSVTYSASQECLQKNFEAGIVCQCNSTYCDQAAPLPCLQRNEFAVYTTSKSGLRYHLTKDTFDIFHPPTDAQYTVNTSSLFQTIQGFGGAFTDAAGIHITSLSNATRKQLMNSYFSVDGNRYTLGRVPIACSDFSTHGYSYADNGLDTFALSPEDYDYKIPLIQEANATSGGLLRMTAATWVSPPYMKTSGTYLSLPYGTIKVEYYADWAAYIMKFLEEYSNNNISIKWLSPQNEPAFPWTSWTAPDYGYWVLNYLGPALLNSSFETRLAALDDQRTQIPWFPLFFLSKPANLKYFNALAVHWYLDFASYPSILDTFHEQYPELDILPTEACISAQTTVRATPVVLGDWEAAENYTQNIIEDTNHWAVGWIDWNLALDEAGGPNWLNNNVDAPVIVDADNDLFYKQPMYYAIGHFSKYVPRGSQRIDIKGSHPGLEIVGFLTPDDNVAIIIHNRNTVNKTVSIKGLRNLGGSATVNVQPKSINTVISKK